MYIVRVDETSGRHPSVQQSHPPHLLEAIHSACGQSLFARERVSIMTRGRPDSTPPPPPTETHVAKPKKASHGPHICCTKDKVVISVRSSKTSNPARRLRRNKEPCMWS